MQYQHSRTWFELESPTLAAQTSRHFVERWDVWLSGRCRDILGKYSGELRKLGWTMLLEPLDYRGR
jgi:hypothetical protein